MAYGRKPFGGRRRTSSASAMANQYDGLPLVRNSYSWDTVSDRIWSSRQEFVYELVDTTTQSIFVASTAGSGKTTTLVEAVMRECRRWGSSNGVLVVAFSKKIAVELQGRMPDVEVATLHSFGNAACRAQGLRTANDPGFVVSNTLKRVMFGTDDRIHGNDYVRFAKERSAVCKLVSLIKAHAMRDPQIEDVEELGERFDVPLTKDTVSLVLATFALGLANREIDFDDQLFLPWFHGWPIKQYRLVFVDESQDLNLVQMELLKMTNARVVAFGDPRQAIYGFRGADADAVATLTDMFDMTQAPLDISYRCPRAVLPLIHDIAPEMQVHDNAIDGSVERVSRLEAQNGDFVLCRCTAPLIDAALALISQGKKATVLGREIGTELIELCGEITTTYGKLNHESIGMWYDDRAAKTRKDRMIALDDQFQCLTSLYSTFGPFMAQEIGKIFGDTVSSGITCMTIHRCKGLETQRVWIVAPELLPHPRATMDWQIEQERNLEFVAYTRFLEKLFIVDPNHRP